MYVLKGYLSEVQDHSILFSFILSSFQCKKLDECAQILLNPRAITCKVDFDFRTSVQHANSFLHSITVSK